MKNYKKSGSYSHYKEFFTTEKIVFGLFIVVNADVDSTLRNRVTKSPTFGAIAKINPTGVQ